MKIILALSCLIVFLGLESFGCSSDGSKTPDVKPATTDGKEVTKASKSGYDLTPMSKEQIAGIVKTLEPLQVEVTQHAGTERAGSGKYANEHKKGTYVSVVGGLPLFRSDDKYDSGTGWPSFTKPIDADHVILRDDGTGRTEVLDARSGAHLGHVFNDGPAPTGKRFCMNSAALKFIPDGQPLPIESQPIAKENKKMETKTETAYFAGGCFWGVEDVFDQTPGVVKAESGYMGGKTKAPTYEEVCSHTTQHAETVRVTYDPSKLTYKQLLKVFFDNHDPTTMNRQGPDVGDQYRSAIFAADDAQKKEAVEVIAELAKTPRFEGRKIVTQVNEPGPTFWVAEDYHQDYHKKHGGSCRVKVY